MKSLGGVLLACAILISAAARADDVECAPDETVDTCVARLVFDYSRSLRVASPGVAESTAVDAGMATEKGAALAGAANATAEENDQPGTATAGDQAASGFTDLLPWLNMVGLLSDSDESDGTIAVDLNFLAGFKRTDAKHDSQLKWEIDVSPTLFDPLAQAIPEDVREERSRQLQDKIDDTADSRLVYSYSFITKDLGRDYRKHHDEFARLIAPRIFQASQKADSAAIDTAFNTRRAAFSVELLNLVNSLKLPAQITDRDADKAKVPVGLFTTFEQFRINALIRKAREGYAQELADHLDELQRAVADPRIYQLAELVLQQPQLLITAQKSFRSELVGPGSWGAKLTYERSFADFSGFRDFAVKRNKGQKKSESKDNCAILDGGFAADVATAVAASDACLSELDMYLDKTKSEQLENALRWKASIEYKQVDDWSYALPDDGVDLDLPRHDRLIASAGFGRAILRSKAGEKDRVDFEAAYDSNMGDDDTYNSRFVVTLTYTRRFMEMDMPISIVYANKSEFLGDTDKQIGLHIGIKYRALDKEN